MRAVTVLLTIVLAVLWVAVVVALAVYTPGFAP
jgi:hypothetical protein